MPFVTSATVRQEKQRIDPEVAALDAITKRGSTLTPDELALWDAWAREWSAFRDAPDGFWTAAAEYDHAQAVEVELNHWQALIAPSAPRLTLSHEHDTETAASFATTAKVVGGLALAAVVALVLVRR